MPRNADELITSLGVTIQILKSNMQINYVTYTSMKEDLDELRESIQESSPKILTEKSEDRTEGKSLIDDPYAEFVDLDTEAYDDFVYERAIPFDIDARPVGSGEILFRAIELAEEVGELLGKIKRVMRDQDGVFTKSDVDSILLELGDILFFVTLLARLFGFRLVKVLVENFIKLSSRRNRGKLQGKGDYR